MLVDATLWEMTPSAVDRPSVLAVLNARTPVFLITSSGDHDDLARDASKLLVHLDTGAPVDIAALDAAPRLTDLLETRVGWRLTVTPFSARVDYTVRTSRRVMADRLRAAVNDRKRGLAR